MRWVASDRVTIADLPEDPHASPFEEENDPVAAELPPSLEGGDDELAPEPRQAGGRHLTLREFREKSERQYIVDTLRMASWNISRTAILLGVERTNLHKKIRSYPVSYTHLTLPTN